MFTLFINLLQHKIEAFSDGDVESVKELFTWEQMLPSVSQAPDTDHHQNIGTHPCCWKLSAVRAPPALTALLAPIHFSLSLLCVHTFLVRTRCCFEVFSHWEMSSKNLVLPHTHERSWNAAFPDAGSSSVIPVGASVVAGMGEQRAAGGCACLMNHHILPTGEHSALQWGHTKI